MDLNNGLDFEKIDPTITFINSVDTDGSFMLNNLLARVIRQKGSFIIFLSFAQKMTHYKSIQAKLANANTLSSLMEKGEFNLIDCMELSKKIMFNERNIELKVVLNEAFSIIKNLTDKFDFKDRKMYIFIDDLSIAHLIGIKDYEQLEFLSKIQFINENIRIVVNIQGFDTNKQFVCDLAHTSDLYVQINRLKTGYSKEIDGQV
jgi:hypothetical protein